MRQVDVFHVTVKRRFDAHCVELVQKLHEVLLQLKEDFLALTERKI